VKIWLAADGSRVAEMPGHENHVYGLAFHPDGKHLVSGDLMGVAKQWEIGTWKPVRDFDAGALHKFDPTFVAHCGGTRSIAFSPDGKHMAIGGIGEVTNAFAGVGVPMVLLYDWATGKQTQVMKTAGAFTGSVWGAAFDPTGQFIVAAGGGGSGGMWVWKLDQPKALVDFKLPATARGIAFHPDGLRVVVPLYDKTVRVYDLAPQPPALAASQAKK
jgi:WD40 repeat protein